MALREKRKNERGSRACSAFGHALLAGRAPAIWTSSLRSRTFLFLADRTKWITVRDFALETSL
eukprot:4262951-Prymnesium_polylepis.2